MENRKDNECLTWAPRAAFFSVPKGNKNRETNSYPVKDGIKYAGISFATQLHDIDKLADQNEKLVIIFFGW